MPEEPKVNLLISIPKSLEQDLRALAQILYPGMKRGALSLTAEQAIKTLAAQSRYQELLKKYKQLQNEVDKLNEEVRIQ